MAECVAEKPRPKPKPRSKAPISEEDQDSNSKNESPRSKSKGSLGSLGSSGSGVTLIEALLNHNRQFDDSLRKSDTELLERTKKVQELEKDLADVQAKSDALDEELKTFAVNDSDKEAVVEIEKYFAIYDRLKSDEKLFKASCNDELERLQKELEALNTDFSDATKADLGAQLERSQARLEAGRVELAGINRKVAAVKRQIEQVPNRMELREYRLRFSELYNQVSATHRSTKQFFSLYNSLEDSKRYLEKELSLLNSIVDSYQEACKSASGREEFLRQLQTINEGLKETCSKVDKRYQTDKSAVENLQAEIQRLLDVKVAYQKCLLELEGECRKNETLLGECKAIEVKTNIQNQGTSSSDSEND